MTTGTSFVWKQVLISIIAQIDGLAPGSEQLLVSEEDEKMADYLYYALEEKVYVIVLDDVHDLKLVESLRNTLPAINNGSVVLITTHLDEATGFADCVFELEPYSTFIKQGLWSFLRVPSSNTRLEEAARMVLENCRGHYVSAFKAFLLLTKTERIVEEWTKIADKENPVFMVEDEIKEVTHVTLYLIATLVPSAFSFSTMLSTCIACFFLIIIGIPSTCMPNKSKLYSPQI